MPEQLAHRRDSCTCPAIITSQKAVQTVGPVLVDLMFGAARSRMLITTVARFFRMRHEGEMQAALAFPMTTGENAVASSDRLEM